MNLPSIKTLVEGLKISKAQAAEIREAMERNKGLSIANRILNGFGIETIGLPDGCFNNCQEPEVRIQYVNMGDTYNTTLLKVNGQYRVGDWGSIVERFSN
jgi:hypothetical protein